MFLFWYGYFMYKKHRADVGLNIWHRGMLLIFTCAGVDMVVQRGEVCGGAMPKEAANELFW